MINRNRNTWDEIVTSDKLELLGSKVMTQLLSEYYREYDYLITHFSQLPHKAREALREIVAGNVSWSEIETVPKETVLIPYTDKSNHRLGEWLNEREFPKLISKIAVSSFNFTRWLSELISQAQSIISYMEENYGDILNLE